MSRIIPNAKDDFVAINNLLAAPTSEILEAGPQLLVWLQDMNWPVSRQIAKQLAKYTNELEYFIIQILHGNDEIWKYWVIKELIYGSEHKISVNLYKQIESIQKNPTISEKEEEVDVICFEAIKRWR